MKKIVLAIDVMGGDKGPSETIQGIAMASKIHPNVKFKLFGNKKKVLSEIEKNKELVNFDFIHTNESIKSDDEPVNALRKLKKLPIKQAITIKMAK